MEDTSLIHSRVGAIFARAKKIREIGNFPSRTAINGLWRFLLNNFSGAFIRDYGKTSSFFKILSSLFKI